MGLNWKTVRREHVERACEVVRTMQAPGIKQRGLFVDHGGASFPAKQVLGIAYRIANGLPPEANLRFSSGESTLARLRALGFSVGRRSD